MGQGMAANDKKCTASSDILVYDLVKENLDKIVSLGAKAMPDVLLWRVHVM